MKNVLKNVSCPCVIDADGLNLLNGKIELLNQCRAPVILTPHMKEMSRLTGWSIDKIMEDRFQALDQIIKQSGPDRKSSIICVLKDSRTVVAQTNRQKFVNLAGNNSMAKVVPETFLPERLQDFLHSIWHHSKPLLWEFSYMPVVEMKRKRAKEVTAY